MPVYLEKTYKAILFTFTFPPRTIWVDWMIKSSETPRLHPEHQYLVHAQAEPFVLQSINYRDRTIKDLR